MCARAVELALTPVTNNTAELLPARLGAAALADWSLTSAWTLTVAAGVRAGGAGPLTIFRGSHSAGR